MIVIELQTSEGKYVETVYIPPFNQMPKVIIWGDRVFFHFTGMIYRECFAVAAVLTKKSFKKMDSETIKKIEKEKTLGTTQNQTDEDLLFGIPKTLDEAIDTLIEFYRNSNIFDLIEEMNEEEFTASTHFGAGMFIRNSWYLWWQENHQYTSMPKSKPPLIEYFNSIGIYHADDISAIIITSAYRKIRNLPIEVEKQAKHYINYWKSQGFKDGKPL